MKFVLYLKSDGKPLFVLKAWQILFQFVFAAASWFALSKQQRVKFNEFESQMSFSTKTAKVQSGF